MTRTPGSGLWVVFLTSGRSWIIPQLVPPNGLYWMTKDTHDECPKPSHYLCYAI